MARELAQKPAISGRKGVECFGKGEIASLCAQKFQEKFPGN
jgi:hypothetical protein